ncbi:MAG: sensor histidine kinase [Lachnospiraceae bacterium]|nr:sensor histidine kinase [Lachnospiraceae bacterium]
MEFLLEFLKDRMYPILWGISVVAVCGLVFWLYSIRGDAIVYSVLLCVTVGLVVLTLDFVRELRRHRARLRSIRTASYERTDLIDEYGVAATDYADLVQALWKRIEDIEDSRFAERREAKDYYTTWVHQIKTPLAVMQMLVKSEDTEQSRAIAAELFRTEQYVDMALGYIRLGEDASDLAVRECDLDELIRASVRRFAPQFIAKKLSFSYEPNKMKVVTDDKWFTFLLEQLLSNAIKYTYEGGVTVTLTDDAKVIVRDTGIGIAPEDVPRIFEKGFTGFNGRTASDGSTDGGRATGLGLYLCRKIAHKLNVGLSVESEVGRGTAFTIDMRKEEILTD